MRPIRSDRGAELHLQFMGHGAARDQGMAEIELGEIAGQFYSYDLDARQQ